ncbi:hypothetical protein N9K19_01265 [Gammaproteobacteria bacterium]|nr:hypothetical protein [Gammaproteobacteria bacterium]
MLTLIAVLTGLSINLVLVFIWKGLMAGSERDHWFMWKIAFVFLLLSLFGLGYLWEVSPLPPCPTCFKI